MVRNPLACEIAQSNLLNIMFVYVCRCWSINQSINQSIRVLFLLRFQFWQVVHSYSVQFSHVEAVQTYQIFPTSIYHNFRPIESMKIYKFTTPSSVLIDVCWSRHVQEAEISKCPILADHNSTEAMACAMVLSPGSERCYVEII